MEIPRAEDMGPRIRPEPSIEVAALVGGAGRLGAVLSNDPPQFRAAPVGRGKADLEQLAQ
uniref:hypothetical protein n=1 Tax=Methylobacterium radiotolerans TaxID=31998 RepID=UPI002739AA21|nr:hypothetical protein [Methylobacterium radiotolerans]